MIRPIKIFLYFVLIVLLILVIDQFLNDFDLFLLSKTRPASPVVDTLSLSLTINEKETIENNDSSLVDSGFTDDKILGLSLPAKTYFIDDSTLIAPAGFCKLLANFYFRAEQAKEHKSLIRILHIGDSQIEADRITGTLRKKFQERYGGMGPGFIIPYDPLRINANVQLSNKGDWVLSYSYREGDLPGSISYGFSSRAAWFRGETAGFTVAPYPWKRDRDAQFSRTKIYVTSGDDSLRVEIFINSNLLYRERIPADKNLQTIKVVDIPDRGKVSFTFFSEAIPVFHGLTLDGDFGVAVDNIAMRGRPWPGFRLAEPNLLKAMASELNIGLFILQFGTNVLPTRTDDYRFYYVHFVKELQVLKTLFPDIPVLVIGVQSSAELVDNKVSAVGRARLISDAQRAAAMDCDMGFLDLQKAMGGIDAAVTWSQQEPPLISSDYMHFTRKGANLVGLKIWNLMEALRVRIEESK